MKKTNVSGILSYLIMGALGLILIIFRKSVDTWLFRAAGIGLIVAGALGVIGGWSMRGERNGKITGEFIAAIAMIAVGIWIVSNPVAFKTTINFIVGAILVVVGAVMLIRNRQDGQSSPVMAGSVMLLGAIVIVFRLVPKLTTWAIVACGVALIYAAVTGAVSELKK